MTIERCQAPRSITDEHFERGASLANVILDQARCKGFGPVEIYIALKMCHLRLDRDFGLQISRFDDNNIEFFLSRSYLPR